jgi:tRNA G18 (ribose-2'-O)-methylase SpoU
MSSHRTKTRAERYEAKRPGAMVHNIAPVCINFMHEENVAFVVRSAACFGAKEVCVIGSLPEKSLLKARSGSTNSLLPIKAFPNPRDFIEYAASQDAIIISAELCEGSVSVYDYVFPKDKMIYLMCGHEEAGVPNDIIINSHAVVHIPMPGQAFCLNTSQCATTLLFEYVRQRGTNRL